MHSKEKLLLIDIGNSLIKCQLATREALLKKGKAFFTSPLDQTELRHVLKDWNYDRVMLSSVVPSATEQVLKLLKKKPFFTLKPRFGRTASEFGGIDLSQCRYSNLLGADRLAAMIGAWNLFGPKPLLVLTVGTAVTFNVVNGQGQFLGGAIAPGFVPYANAVQRHTALLPSVNLETKIYHRKFPSLVGKSTQQQMLAAAYYGWRGSVKEIIAATQKEMGGQNNTASATMFVVATGGGAASLSKDLPEIDQVVSNLALEGLRCLS